MPKGIFACSKNAFRIKVFLERVRENQFLQKMVFPGKNAPEGVVFAKNTPSGITSMNKTITIFSPAKVNLFLGVTGLRGDGFHDIVSVVAPLRFGDVLHVTRDPSLRNDVLECDCEGVPRDGNNLVMKAAKAWREVLGMEEVFFDIFLEKRIPMGAGLGGGSSNAVAFLKAANALTGNALSDDSLLKMSAQLGSDCPFFVKPCLSILRGRGERIETVGEPMSGALVGRRVMVFQPGFPVETAWAYATMRENALYTSPEIAEGLLQRCLSHLGDEVPFFWNQFESIVFEKYLVLPVLVQEFKERFQVEIHMTGSGSACFGLLSPRHSFPEIEAWVKNYLGKDTFIVETFL